MRTLNESLHRARHFLHVTLTWHSVTFRSRCDHHFHLVVEGRESQRGGVLCPWPHGCRWEGRIHPSFLAPPPILLPSKSLLKDGDPWLWLEYPVLYLKCWHMFSIEVAYLTMPLWKENVNPIPLCERKWQP